MQLTVGMSLSNSPEAIAASIESILAQDWPGEFELLIADPGADKKSHDVLSKYAPLPCVRIVPYEANKGQAFARNTILKEARGEFLAWIDAGEIWASDKIRVQFDSLTAEYQSHNRAISICPFAFSQGETNRSDQGLARPALGFQDIARILDASIPAYLSATLCRTDWYRSVGGFDESLPGLHDIEITLRLLKFGCFFVLADVDQPLASRKQLEATTTGANIYDSLVQIREKHQFLFQRFGSQFYFTCRRTHHQIGMRCSIANREISDVLRHRVSAWYFLIAIWATWTLNQSYEAIARPLRQMSRR